MAVSAFFGKQVGRIILTRPAVEAGESLGFLPGTVSEKVDPYFRPLFDALYDMIDGEKLAALIEKGEIEVAPLAFMRGRTLNDSFIILDEAQNTSPEQMKMFLTRLGFGSKMVVTGDVTQIDLPHSRTSGLVTVPEVLDDIDDITIVEFDGHDVVRHKLVQRIVNAYKAHDDRWTRRGRSAPRPAAAPRTEQTREPRRSRQRARARVDEELVARLVATVLEAEGVRRRRGRCGVRRRGAHPRPQPRAPRQDEVTDVLSFPLEDGDESPARRGRGWRGRVPAPSTGRRRGRRAVVAGVAGPPRCSATSWSARARRCARRGPTRCRRPSSSPCSSPTARCTCSATTTRPTPARWRSARPRCSSSSPGRASLYASR